MDFITLFIKNTLLQHHAETMMRENFNVILRNKSPDKFLKVKKKFRALLPDVYWAQKNQKTHITKFEFGTEVAIRMQRRLHHDFSRASPERGGINFAKMLERDFMPTQNGTDWFLPFRGGGSKSPNPAYWFWGYKIPEEQINRIQEDNKINSEVKTLSKIKSKNKSSPARTL